MSASRFAVPPSGLISGVAPCLKSASSKMMFPRVQLLPKNRLALYLAAVRDVCGA